MIKSLSDAFLNLPSGNGVYIDDSSKKGVAFIGTNHLFNIMSPKYLPLRRRVLSLAKGAACSMVEGTEHRNEHSDLTQHLVVDNCRGEIIYSEKDISYKALLAPYGVPEGMYGLWAYWVTFNKSIDSESSTDQSNDMFYKRLYGLSQDSVAGFDFERTARQGYITLKKFSHEHILLATISFLDFLQNVRDYEIFGPKFDELLGREGNKVVALGLAHIPPLIERLKGKHPPKPLNWNEFVSSINNASRAVLEAAVA